MVSVTAACLGCSDDGIYDCSLLEVFGRRHDQHAEDIRESDHHPGQHQRRALPARGDAACRLRHADRVRSLRGPHLAQGDSLLRTGACSVRCTALPCNNNNRLFMVPRLVRAQSVYKDIRIHSFHHTHTHTLSLSLTHTHTHSHITWLCKMKAL